MYVKIQLNYADAHDLIFGIENPIAKSKRQNGSHPLLGKTHFSLPIEIIIHVCMYSMWAIKFHKNDHFICTYQHFYFTCASLVGVKGGGWRGYIKYRPRTACKTVLTYYAEAQIEQSCSKLLLQCPFKFRFGTP